MKKVFIKTYGCSFNQADSENMAGILEASGRYKITDEEKDADLVIINSCTVKNNAETKFWRDVFNIRKPKILAGCVPEAEVDKEKFRRYSILGTNHITDIVDAADDTLKGNIVQLYGKKHIPRLNIPKLRKSSIIEILPINEGCLGNCTFCKTKAARGHLHSYPIEDIVKEARAALNSGVKEIWLTSQDTACYGYDINTNISKLMKRLLEMKRDFRIRLGMGNPDYIPDYIEELIDAFSDERVFKFLHLPLQAGSDAVLKSMKRNYPAKQFLDIIRRFRQEFPMITISSDIIVGYPTESENDFEESLHVIEEASPDVINISRYWPRPGTLGAKLKQHPSEVMMDRSRKMRKLFFKIAEQNHKKWLNWEGKILIDEPGKNNTMIGRNFAYKPVIVKGNFKLGKELVVKVDKTTKFDLRAKII